MRMFWLLIVAAQMGFAAESGEAIFRTYCAPCHGAHGEGGRGANLTVRRFAHAPDDAALSAVITNGIPGTQMPATRMTPEENEALVAYVRGLGRSQAAAVAGNGENGKRLFEGKGNCGRCHT